MEAELDNCVPGKVNKSGIHQDYMQALDDRIKLEVAGKTKGLEYTWLLDYLKMNDWWVRKEHALQMVRMLKSE